MSDAPAAATSAASTAAASTASASAAAAGRGKISAMSAEVVDSNPYSRLMALQRMGIVKEYQRIRDKTVRRRAGEGGGKNKGGGKGGGRGWRERVEGEGGGRGSGKRVGGRVWRGVGGGVWCWEG